MRNSLTEVEEAVIELGKVQSLVKVLDAGITQSPEVNDIQNVYYVVTDLFDECYNALLNAFYNREGKHND